MNPRWLLRRYQYSRQCWLIAPFSCFQLQYNQFNWYQLITQYFEFKLDQAVHGEVKQIFWGVSLMAIVLMVQWSVKLKIILPIPSAWSKTKKEPIGSFCIDRRCCVTGCWPDLTSLRWWLCQLIDARLESTTAVHYFLCCGQVELIQRLSLQWHPNRLH